MNKKLRRYVGICAGYFFLMMAITFGTAGAFASDCPQARAQGGGNAGDHCQADNPNAQCRDRAYLINPCGPWIGASANNYPGTGTSLVARITNMEQRTGRQMSLVHAYNSVGDNVLTDEELYFVNRPDTHLLLNWKPTGKWANAAGGNDAVNAGIDQMALSIKAVAPKKIFLSVFHEPQNDVSANNPGDTCQLAGGGGAGTPADYVNMWHNVRARFDALGVDNVVWIPIFQSYAPLNCLIPKLYPGDAYVNWVGFDMYDNGKGWDADVSAIYNYLNSLGYSNKPYMITEWGIAGARPQSEAYKFYDDIKASIDANKYPNLKGYVVWDSKGAKFYQVGYGGPGPVSNPANYYPDLVEQEHFNNLAHDPHLQ